MAFTSIDANTIKVGDPITKELLDLVKSNFDDHETRINNNETTGGTVFVFNGFVQLAGLDANDPHVIYVKALQNFVVTDFRAQIFDKGSVVAGNLTFDLQKATNTNNANFNTILNTDLSFNFAVDASYLEKNASLNATLTSILTGEVLRVKVESTPTDFGGKVLISISGE